MEIKQGWREWTGKEEQEKRADSGGEEVVDGQEKGGCQSRQQLK